MNEEQKPVAWMFIGPDGVCEEIEYGEFGAENHGATLLYTHPAPSVMRILERVALIAHCGGLANLSESDALTAIRKLTINFHDWNMTIDETKAALTTAKEAGYEQT